eukprot:8019008-Alexandrium_andersonii.AAC.1
MSYVIGGFVKTPRWKLVYDPSFTSAKNRKLRGLAPFDLATVPARQQLEQKECYEGQGDQPDDEHRLSQTKGAVT